MAKLTKKLPPDRSKIDIADASQMKRWSKTLDVSPEELLRAIETVGNAAAAVRKELQTKAERRSLKPDDFPVEARGTAVIALDGRSIAATSSATVANADRLNHDEAGREDDKWFA